MAQRVWFGLIPDSPRNTLRRVRAWDLAATEVTHGRDPDWTVGTLLARLADGTWVVEHVVRVRYTPAKVDDLMLQTAVTDGRGTLVREWEDPGQAGKAVTAAHRRMLAGWDYEAVRASGEKTQQWRPFLVQAEGGNVKVVEAGWTREWLDEMAAVPYGLHDDQADSVALAFNTLSEHKAKGPGVGTILPSQPTVSGPTPGAWQERYFRR